MAFIATRLAVNIGRQPCSWEPGWPPDAILQRCWPVLGNPRMGVERDLHWEGIRHAEGTRTI
jgi:hypothetical protein